MSSIVIKQGANMIAAFALSLAIVALPNVSVQAAGEAVTTTGAQPAQCAEPGVWLDLRTGTRVSPQTLFDSLAMTPLVLLGETHDNAEHHRWQLHTLAGLLGQVENMVIGFEAFPRRVQPVLDRWTAGELTEKAFLQAVGWDRVWGFDAGLYMPLFEFARMHRLPMVALNVDRELVSRVGADGWEAVPIDDREGLSTPAEPEPDYLRALAQVFADKMQMTADGRLDGMSSLRNDNDTVQPSDSDDLLERPAFKRFVAAQLTWDRAMAEALASARRNTPDALVVGIMGSGHLQYFHGVPHQLKALGLSDKTVLIPVAAGQGCALVGSDYADHVFTVRPRSAEQPTPQRQRLGIRISPDDRGVLVRGVAPDSIAQAADIRQGDRIIRAAGVDVKTTKALIAIVERQAPGTWLPLTIERGDQAIELVAKFLPIEDEGQK